MSACVVSTALRQRGLTILETRRMRGDQTEVFKIVTRYQKVLIFHKEQ